MDHLILIVSNWIFICMLLHPCFVFAAKDPDCTRTKCECCIDNQCGQGKSFPNECTNGCIGGHTGLRCYLLCNNNCKTCNEGNLNVCESCYDAYFRDGNKHCIQCPPNCKECTSRTKCTSCKKGFGNRENSMTCEHCSENCDGTCSFKTGICDTCAENKYGLFCDMDCPEKCKDLPSVRVSRCEQLTGRCHFGCDEGYFGFTCNKSCSNLCIDNVCIQDSGKCTRGCKEAYDETECFLGSERPSEKCNSTIHITVVLGSILGVAAIAATAVGIIILVKRRSSRNRQDTSTKVYYQNRRAIDAASDDTMPVPEARKDNYDQIKNVEGTEHDYQQITVSVSD